MNDNIVWIILIIAAAVVAILFIFRRQLSDFRFKGGKEGVDMQIKTRKDGPSQTPVQSAPESSSINVSGNSLWGHKNKIEVERDSTTVKDNKLVGEDQEILVQSETKKSKK